MFARGFLCFYPACPERSRRAPLLASHQNSPKSNYSPTYAAISRKSNDSPTYAKTGGWGAFSAPTFKYHLKCRRADISSLGELFSVPARRSFSGGGSPPAAHGWHVLGRSDFARADLKIGHYIGRLERHRGGWICELPRRAQAKAPASEGGRYKGCFWAAYVVRSKMMVGSPW
jgi:hypothetical protein